METAWCGVNGRAGGTVLAGPRMRQRRSGPVHPQPTPRCSPLPLFSPLSRKLVAAAARTGAPGLRFAERGLAKSKDVSCGGAPRAREKRGTGPAVLLLLLPSIRLTLFPPLPFFFFFFFSPPSQAPTFAALAEMAGIARTPSALAPARLLLRTALATPSLAGVGRTPHRLLAAASLLVDASCVLCVFCV